MPTGIETISDPGMENFICKLQVHLKHSAEVIVGAQAGIYLLNIEMGDVTENNMKIWCAMGDTTKKLISHGAVLYNLDLDFRMKEYSEAHLLNVNIKTSLYGAMAQATSEAANIGSVSATLTKLVTLGSGGHLYAMYHALKWETITLEFCNRI